MKLFDITGPCMKFVSAQAKKIGLSNINMVDLTEDSVKLTTNDGKTYRFILQEENSSPKES